MNRLDRSILTNGSNKSGVGYVSVTDAAFTLF